MSATATMEAMEAMKARIDDADPVYFIHRRKGIKFEGRWYNSPGIQRHVGSGVFVRKDKDSDAIHILNQQSELIGLGLASPDEPAEPFDRLGAYDCVHPGSFIVGRFGVMVNGRFYNNPILEKHIADRVRVAITPDPRHLAILQLDGKHICEAVQVEHADIGNAEGELMYRIEITDQFLRYLREVINITESEQSDLHRRLETERQTQNPGWTSGALKNPTCTCGACFDSDTFAQANASHAKRLEEDDSQPSPDYME